MTLYLEPLKQNKHFLRCQQARATRFAGADNALYDFGTTYDFSFHIDFRSWHVVGATSRRILWMKTGTGDHGGVGVGITITLDANGGGLQVALLSETGGGVISATTTHNSTLTGLNDGLPHSVVIVFKRGVAADTLTYYIDGVLDSTHTVADHVGNTFDNNGAPLIRDNSGGTLPFCGDYFMLRIFSGPVVGGISGEVSATGAMSLVFALNALTVMFDWTYATGKPFQYTSDPATTPGCILELFRETTDATVYGAGWWNALIDYSENLLSYAAVSDTVRACWGYCPRVIYRATLSNYYSVGDETRERVSVINNFLKRDGGVERGYKNLRPGKLSVPGVIKADDEAAYLAARRVLNVLTTFGDGSGQLRDSLRGMQIDYSCIAKTQFNRFEGWRRATRGDLELAIPLTAWRDDAYLPVEVTTVGTPGVIMAYNFTLINRGDLKTYPRFMVWSSAAANGYFVIVNETTGESFYFGYINQVNVWRGPTGEGTDDNGKAVYICCDTAEIFWLDLQTSKQSFISGDLFGLVPGVNRITFGALPIGGNVNVMDIQVEFNEYYQ